MVDVGKLDNTMRAEDDVREGDVVMIADEGAIVTFNEGKANEAKKLELSFNLANNEVKKWPLNNTTMKAFREAWGKDSKKWIGKEATVGISVQNVNGTMRKIIYLFPKEGGI